MPQQQAITEFNPKIDGQRNRNWLNNGQFHVWQRGTSFAGASLFGYGPDRWLLYSAGGAVTFSQVPFTSSTICREDTVYALKIARTAGTTQGQSVGQGIPDVKSLSNRVATLSFVAWADNPVNCLVFIAQNFGSSGSASIYPLYQSVTITTTPQRFILTTTIPSTYGKTIGAGNHVRVEFDVDGSSVNNTYLAEIQLEEGPVFTGFRPKFFNEELEDCRRFFQKSFPYSVAPANNGSNGPGQVLYSVANATNVSFSYFTIPLIPKMFKRPSFILYQTNGSAANKIYNFTRGVSSTYYVDSSQTNESQIQAAANSISGWVVGDLMGFAYTADADF